MIKYTYSIPKYLYDERIHGYISDLISRGSTSFYDLHDHERDLLTTKIIDVLGTDAYSIIIGSDDFDKTLTYFSNFLKTANKEDAFNLLDQLRKNALDHYAYDLNNLFEEIMESNKTSRKMDAGLFPYMDSNTGEIEWRKYA